MCVMDAPCSGKFGVVHRCQEKKTGKKFAAKFIITTRKEDREDVEREVDIMKSLQHKRLLQLYDAFDDGKKEMCLILELYETSGYEISDE